MHLWTPSAWINKDTSCGLKTVKLHSIQTLLQDPCEISRSFKESCVMSFSLIVSVTRVKETLKCCCVYRPPCGKVQIFCFRPDIPFLGKFHPKIRIVSLSLNLWPTLVRICRIHWWCSLFSFPTKNTLFGQNWSQFLKLFVSSEIWWLHWYKYAEFSGDAHLSCSEPKITFLCKLSL